MPGRSAATHHCQIASLDLNESVRALACVAARPSVLYGPQTELASVSVLNMDDTGEVASAAAMAMMIFYTNIGARALHAALARWLERRTQAWRSRAL